MNYRLSNVVTRSGQIGDRVRLRPVADWWPGYTPFDPDGTTPFSFTVVGANGAAPDLSVAWVPSMSRIAHEQIVGTIIDYTAAPMPGLLPTVQFEVSQPGQTAPHCETYVCHPTWLGQYRDAPADPLGPECTCPSHTFLSGGCTCGRAARERAVREAAV